MFTRQLIWILKKKIYLTLNSFDILFAAAFNIIFFIIFVIRNKSTVPLRFNVVWKKTLSFRTRIIKVLKLTVSTRPRTVDQCCIRSSCRLKPWTLAEFFRSRICCCGSNARNDEPFIIRGMCRWPIFFFVICWLRGCSLSLDDNWIVFGNIWNWPNLLNDQLVSSLRTFGV